VKTLLEHGDLEMGHAKAMLSLPPEVQCDIARKVAANGLSVRETENIVRRIQQPKSNHKSNPSPLDPRWLTIQNNLCETLGAKVKISSASNGKGRLTIQYNSPEELEGILQHIK